MSRAITALFALLTAVFGGLRMGGEPAAPANVVRGEHQQVCRRMIGTGAHRSEVVVRCPRPGG